MKKLALIFVILCSNFAYSDTYKSAQRFQAGDVLSADVINDILDRIELTLKEITRAELIGTWTATQYWCGNSGVDPTDDANVIGSGNGCSRFQLLTGGTNLDGGLALKRTDTVTISAASGSDNIMDVAFAARSMFVPDGQGNAYASWNQAKTHQCSFIGEGAIFGCALDASINEAGRRYGAYFNTQRLSPTRIKLFWGPWRGNGLFNVVYLDKTGLVPVTPTTLAVAPSSTATVSDWESNLAYALDAVVKSDTNTYTVTTAGTSGSLAPIHTSGAEANGSASLTFKETITVGSSASVTLTWTAGDATEINYDVKRKDSAEGTYTSVGTPTAESYVDTTVVTGKTYWYRVFAINTNGTSLGTNVINITL
jgi:hypothetical protein